jgi:hypothetical protein
MRKNRDSMSIEFHGLYSGALTAGAAAISMNPVAASYSSRLQAEADAWCHYRIRQLRFKLHPTPTTTAIQACGFVGGVQDTAPATVATIMELIPSAYMGVDQSVPSEWIRVSPSELAGPLPWYKAIAGAADGTEESPGVFCVAGATTEAFAIELRGVFEFKTAAATANTPLGRQLIARRREERLAVQRERERAHIVGVLSSPPVPASSQIAGLFPTK